VDARIDETPSDPDLVAGVASRDATALVTLFRRRRAEVYRFALHLTGRAATAEDITQEVFMTVIRDAARYDAPRGPVVAWLLGIARNLARRRLERDRLLQPIESAHDRMPDPARNPEVDLARAERIALVRQAVMTLPIRYREVILLCDLQELSYVDAAAALQCAVGTIRSRLHRARALLAAELEGIGVSPAEGDRPSVDVRKRGCFA
jgi:RNA polymerase sigma-70 factor (ECF subfamily)